MCYRLQFVLVQKA